MSYSLGLSLYNLTTRPGQPLAAPRPERPRGRLVWLHAPDEPTLVAMQELAAHLQDEDGLPVLLTTPVTGLAPKAAKGTKAARAAKGMISQVPPNDHPQDARDFLDHWQPEIAIFAGGELFPACIHECAQRRISLILVGGRSPVLPPGREGWFPGLIKAALAEFRHVLVIDDSAAHAFRKAGLRQDRLVVTGRMEEASAALPHVASDRDALAALLVTRPIWLAADVAAAEIPHVISAHRRVLQFAHRLLLIVVPQDETSAGALAERLEIDHDWRVALRRADQDPDQDTEIYICDASEYGLWYQLAQVTFLGGSLDGQGCARDPMEPASLGSAILYGPRPGEFGQTCGRLGAARAARMVASGHDLAEALGDLLSPDRAARQAAAAWAIASEGADVTDRVLKMIRDIMDGTE